MPEFVVVAEDDTDARMAFLLANRVFEEHGPSWIDEAYFPYWVDLEGNSHSAAAASEVPPPKCTLWRNLDEQRFAGKFLRSNRRELNGKGKGFDYARAHKAKMLFIQLRKIRAVDALILVRDLDPDHPEPRRHSLEQVRNESPELIIVLATPFPNQEAWVLNLFQPTEAETQILIALRQELGFDPCQKPEELTATDQIAKRSIKRVVRELTGGSRDRKEQCWSSAQLSILKNDDDERGIKTNLKAYLNEVKQLLLPIIDPSFPGQKAQS